MYLDTWRSRNPKRSSGIKKIVKSSNSPLEVKWSVKVWEALLEKDKKTFNKIVPFDENCNLKRN